MFETRRTRWYQVLASLSGKHAKNYVGDSDRVSDDLNEGPKCSAASRVEQPIEKNGYNEEGK